MNLTIAYITSRKEPQFQWFFDSLRRQQHADQPERIVVVDRWQAERSEAERAVLRDAIHVAPKPGVWQGSHRLTKADYFAQCNARNTALCLAPDGWIAFVDDLSVLMPGWLEAVREATRVGYIACGAYQKVNAMKVINGELLEWTEFSHGRDSRWQFGGRRAMNCRGAWAYGCSLAMPVEAALRAGGYPEALCDGMGYEDVVFGQMLENLGYRFAYDRRMLTMESEELHAQLPVMRREDPCRGDTNAVPRDDQSHDVVRVARTLRFHPNYFGDEGIRGLRTRILRGDPFPVVQIPEHRYFDGKPLRQLPDDVPAVEEVVL